MIDQCPCGSLQPYSACCGQYIENEQVAPTPEALMRSRYVAYTKANIDYIEKTMVGKALLGFDKMSAYEWAKSVKWLALKVVDAPPPVGEHGIVEFIVRYKQQGKAFIMQEISQFIFNNGAWYYCDGTVRQ